MYHKSMKLNINHDQAILHYVTNFVLWHIFPILVHFCPVYCVQIIMSTKSRISFGLQMVFVYLYITPSHYHHCANLSEDIELINCLSDIFCRVCEWDQVYSLGFPLCNLWDCVFSVYALPLWWLREYIYVALLSSSNRKYELLSIG